MKRRVLSSVLVSSIAVAIFLTSHAGIRILAEQTQPRVDFDRDIRPILSDNCFACHGPDEKQRMVDLRLDTKDGAFADRGGYQVIVSGKASASRLYQKISAKSEEERMPPSDSGRKLTAKQIELIGSWIDQGARWQTHWAFDPPRRPPLPTLKDGGWSRNPIDQFVLARLEHEGLKPSPEADRLTLLRRVTLDLTGLPPTPAELDTFLQDRSPDAYERRVDQLLGSPHYGERMAMQWLDLARYADTHGYHIDSLREMWHWRDWVIDGFNRNMPFDQFTIEQLAGDLVPNATLAQKIATDFNRNHMINFEGGAIPEEYHNEYVVDRVEATSNTWMGLTMGCARCHDHKYDPIKQEEFYRFYAFFNTVPEKGLDGQKGNAGPILQLPSPQQQSQLDALKHAIADKEAALPEKEIAALQMEWEKTRPATLPAASTAGLMAHYSFEGDLKDNSGHCSPGKLVKGEVVYDFGAVAKAVEFDGETSVSFDNPRILQKDHPFSVAMWLNPSGLEIGPTGVGVLQALDGPQERKGFEILLDETVKLPRQKKGVYLLFRLTHQLPDNAIQFRTREPVLQDSWVSLLLTYDGSGRASGFRLYLEGKPREIHVVQDNLTGSTETSASMQIGNKNLAKPYKGGLDDLCMYGRVLSSEEIRDLANLVPVRSMLAEVAGKPFQSSGEPKADAEGEDEDKNEGESDKPKESKEEKELKASRAKLKEYFLTYEAPQSLRQVYADLKQLREQKEELEEHIPTTMVMKEMQKSRETFVLARGDYRNKGKKVSPGVPSCLPPFPKDLPVSRLGLAKWLVNSSHPLTARVAVNRFWQNYFGIGLVKTAEDFGAQGELPSHPELLDWLATEFVRSGWDIKAMQRLIVTSATYRQSSRVTKELLERDPENRLLARGARFRLPAETVRDNALSIGGLLDSRIGGPSVYPYQPKGLWEEMAFGDVFSGQAYTPSEGRDLYRRSMYSIWKRTVPPPSLVTFDAPDREKCTARRARTNTPLQALVLLNDPTYVEAARGLAQLALTQAGKDPVERVRYAFRMATARFPDSRELKILQDAFSQQLVDYRRQNEAATRLLQVGESPTNPNLDTAELAAWTTVASIILNLDETITKE